MGQNMSSQASTNNAQVASDVETSSADKAAPSTSPSSASELETKAQSIVNKYALGAAGIGLIPFPVVDMVTLSGAQIKMIHDISHIYGFTIEGKQHLLSIVGALTASVGIPTLIMSTLASTLKGIPGVGTAISYTAAPATFGALTFAIGKVFIEHFESGGTYLDLDPARMRDAMKSYYQDALKRFKKDTSEESKAPGEEPSAATSASAATAVKPDAS